MTKLSLIAVIWVWHCVVNGQLPVNNFDPYHPYYIPYHTSAFVNQPDQHNYEGTAAHLGAHFIKNKTTRSNHGQPPPQQLKDTNSKLEKAIADLAEKAAKSDLDSAVNDLNSALQTTNANLDEKAAKSDLDTTNQVVDDLKIKTSPNAIGTVPTSCDDLKTIGFVKSGIYSVMSNKQVQNVYCDFTKSNSADMQKLIGTVDVKSTAVYFHAQLSTSGYSTINTAIPFDLINFNVGNGYSATGVFVAPTAGNYYFAFSGISANNALARVLLQVKSGTGDWTSVGETYGHTNLQTFTLQSTLQLLEDDQVRLYLSEGRIHDNSMRFYTNFDGWLIEEKELTV